jgi:hypothetical protein
LLYSIGLIKLHIIIKCVAVFHLMIWVPQTKLSQNKINTPRTRKKDLFENVPACCSFKNLPDCNKMFSLVLNFQQSGRAFELCSFC